MTKLEKARLKAKLSTTEAASIFGYSYPQYLNIEKGRTSRKLVEGYLRFSREVNVPVEDLL